MKMFDTGLFYKLENCSTKFDNNSSTHFKLYFTKGTILVSYNVPVVIKTNHGIYLTKHWDYSTTTLYYVRKFLNLKTNEIRNKIKEREFKIVDINFEKSKYKVL